MDDKIFNNYEYEYDTSSQFSSSEYEVESIIDKKEKNGVMLYKVHWKGYKAEKATWEPYVNLLNCLDAVEEYERKMKNPNLNTKVIRKCKQESFLSEVSKSKKERIVKKRNTEKIKCVYSIKNYNKDNKELIDLFKKHKLIRILSAKKDIPTTSNEFFLSCELSNCDTNPYISNLLLKNFYPIDLIDFYESKINFQN